MIGCRDYWRCPEGIVEPLHQAPVRKEIQADHGRKIGQGPCGPGQVVEPPQEKQGDEGCPNLGSQGVLAGPDEGLDLQILLERLEEQFDFPLMMPL